MNPQYKAEIDKLCRDLQNDAIDIRSSDRPGGMVSNIPGRIEGAIGIINNLVECLAIHEASYARIEALVKAKEIERARNYPWAMGPDYASVVKGDKS